MPTTRTDARTATILVIEDDWPTARHIQQILARLGYRVAGHACSADAALALIEAAPPDLALMDIQLQGETDGIELAHAIGERWSFPVVYLTARSDAGTLERLKDLEPAGYVCKPFQEEQLRVAVELALLHAGERGRRKADSARQRSELEAKAASLEACVRRVALALNEAPSAVLSTTAPPLPARLREILDAMSPREVEILHLLLANHRMGTIARELSLSGHTVRNHLRSIFRKAGVHSQEELLQLMEPCRRHSPFAAR